MPRIKWENRETNLAFVAVNRDLHSLHIDILISYAFEACLELLREGIKMFRRNGANVDRQINSCGSHVLAEIDIGTWERFQSPGLQDVLEELPEWALDFHKLLVERRDCRGCKVSGQDIKCLI